MCVSVCVSVCVCARAYDLYVFSVSVEVTRQSCTQKKRGEKEQEEKKPALTTITLCGGVKNIHENYTVFFFSFIDSTPFSTHLC